MKPFFARNLPAARKLRTACHSVVLKGHGFSRAAKRRKKSAALAAEGMQLLARIFPRGLKPGNSSLLQMTRLKPCPFKSASFFLCGFVLAATCLSIQPCAAQTAAQSPPASQQSTQPASQNPQQPGGKVVFSRSTDENGQTQELGSAAAQAPIQITAAPSAEDAERQAVTYSDFDLDVRLHSAAQQIAVRALVTVRNDGNAPLARLPVTDLFVSQLGEHSPQRQGRCVSSSDAQLRCRPHRSVA
jgi:hypothetical protein